MRRRLNALLAVLAFAVTLAIDSPRPGFGHQALSGWAYPMECCGGEDCREIDERWLRPIKGGWLVPNTGETFAYGRTKPSPDGRWHICQGPDPERPNQTYCLFTPPWMW